MLTANEIRNALQTQYQVVIVKQPVSVYVGGSAILVSRELAKEPIERITDVVNSALDANTVLTPEDAKHFRVKRSKRNPKDYEDPENVTDTANGRKTIVEPIDTSKKICLGCCVAIPKEEFKGQGECPECKRKTESHRYVEQVRQATGQELLFGV